MEKVKKVREGWGKLEKVGESSRQFGEVGEGWRRFEEVGERFEKVRGRLRESSRRPEKGREHCEERCDKNRKRHLLETFKTTYG